MTAVNSTQLTNNVRVAAFADSTEKLTDHEKISCLLSSVDKLYELNQGLLAYRSSVSLILEDMADSNLAHGMSVLIDPILDQYSEIHLKLLELLKS